MNERDLSPNPAELHGAVVIVTGAGRGIGRVVAEGIAAAGARVVLGSRSLDQLKAVEAGILERGGQAVAIPFDVMDPTSVEAMVDAAAAQWGQLDGLVNNAGVAQHTRIVDMAIEDWERILRTNLTGAFLTMQATLRHLSRGGSIVNVASVFGETPVRGYGAYCASKAGLLHLTRVAAAEHARDGIRINALAPGYIATPLNEEAFSDEATRESVLKQIPLRRIADPEELVPLVQYLLSDVSAYVTGSVFTIDGGFAL
jgi:NAD(P)-dependent dehydrogenase (short-subunit alcohol dehydrogenase family)